MLFPACLGTNFGSCHLTSQTSSIRFSDLPGFYHPFLSVAMEGFLADKGNSLRQKFKVQNEIDHPVVLFNDTPVKKVIEHKHLGIVLDSKLSFYAHIKPAISKTRKGIGMLKFLSRYLLRHTLNELYKLHVRPHLDYGDVTYHTPSKLCDLVTTKF